MQPQLVDQESDTPATPQSIGDDKVHFDPIRAVQSIKLTNNYRTAQSNDNFLSTVILNTYFFANAVLHHSEINQPPPKLPYDTTDYHTSSESCTSSDDNSDDGSSYYSTSTSDEDGTASDDDDDIKINHNNYNTPNKSSLYKKTLSQNLDQIQHASSTPPSHHKSSTLTNIYYVPSQMDRRHTANPHKASQILGIDSEAVIFANAQHSEKPLQALNHRKSNSFSNMHAHKVTDEMKTQQIHNDEHDNHAADVMSDDEFAFKQLDFDKFRPQKRNTPTRSIRRSNTVDLGHTKHAKRVLFTQEILNNADTKNNRSRHNSLLFGNNNISSKPLRKSRRSKGEISDVIEIKFKIDCTKKGYLFLGLIPANKINNVVRNGFMFGFNEYTYSFHGYSGKLYHDKLQSDYYFNPNRKHKEKAKAKHNKANTVDITSGIAEIANIDNNDEDVIQRANTERKEEEEDEKEDIKEDESNNNHRRNTFYYNDKHQRNRKLPVLQSGDIVTLKMKLNRNQGKFSVIYCINDVDCGTAWKNIEPGVTIGATLVGRKEQITLMSCSYKPYKNDKSCVIL